MFVSLSDEQRRFVHTVREPWWHEHRLLKYDDPVTHLHVFGPECPEVIRHLMFHDWLVEHPDDRERYAAAKPAAATEMNGRAVGVTLPNFIEQKIVETEPGFRGDTATGSTKPAKISTGATINVPLFINEGESIKVDTRTGAYLERVNRR